MGMEIEGAVIEAPELEEERDRCPRYVQAARHSILEHQMFQEHALARTRCAANQQLGVLAECASRFNEVTIGVRQAVGHESVPDLQRAILSEGERELAVPGKERAAVVFERPPP